MRPLLFLIAITWSSAGLADDAPITTQLRGRLGSQTGAPARGTVVLGERAIIVTSRTLFRERTESVEYGRVRSFVADVGPFRGTITFSMADGSSMQLVAPRADARSLRDLLTTRILGYVAPMAPVVEAPKPEPRRATTITIQD
jgi:hypothetical protein